MNRFDSLKQVQHFDGDNSMLTYLVTKRKESIIINNKNQRR